MKKYNLKDDTLNEPQLRNFYNYPIYPRHSKNNLIKGSLK